MSGQTYALFGEDLGARPAFLGLELPDRVAEAPLPLAAGGAAPVLCAEGEEEAAVGAGGGGGAVFDPSGVAVVAEEAISEEKEGRSWGAGDGAIASVALIVKEEYLPAGSNVVGVRRIFASALHSVSGSRVVRAPGLASGARGRSERWKDS